MAKLCIWLPPLAADYSGVCSVFFDLNGITAVSDASCCTDNYVNYDEPRWAEQRKNVFCISLRTIDAVLGSDAKIVSRILEAAAVLRPELIAFVGTPVSALIGMDAEGIACEIEAWAGVPSLGFASSGFRYYDEGIVMAGSALIDRFAEDALIAVPRRLNILGMTPLDFGSVGNDLDFCAFFVKAGFDVRCFCMGMSLDDIRTIGSAGINLAVSSAGIALA
ncbi:MAG: nitrogenase component 1, partial [Methanocorpusculum sp.]|nr:nitrogenase component 1 [Methanocorpusculum sp.]